MKESMFDVLMYLFENYMEEDTEFDPDQESLTTELSQAGFPRVEISKAFSWLEGLSDLRDSGSQVPHEAAAGSVRVYSGPEMDKIDRESRGFLLFMEQSGVLDSVSRELVIDRLMALEVDEISIEQLKWVILMVMFNRPGQEHAYALLEDVVFDEMEGHIN
jgi:Smg protein